MDYLSILGQFAHFTRLNLNEKKIKYFKPFLFEIGTTFEFFCGLKLERKI